MSNIVVTNIQRLCVNDGPGVRTVVFLKGCSLQCPWCCNPEAIHVANNEVFNKGVCAFPEKKVYCHDCERFDGERNILDCPVQAYNATGKNYSADELLHYLLRDEATYTNGGGVTFSGGEPLLQIRGLIPVLEALKAKNIHVAFETALYVPAEYILQALLYVDYWLVDLKFQFGYAVNNDFDFVGISIQQNLHLLRQSISGDSIRYRMVWMHEAMNKAESMIQKLHENQISCVELLECHSLAENKYRQLGMPMRKFSAPTEDDMGIMKDLLKSNNINYSYTRL